MEYWLNDTNWIQTMEYWFNDTNWVFMKDTRCTLFRGVYVNLEYRYFIPRTF